MKNQNLKPAIQELRDAHANYIVCKLGYARAKDNKITELSYLGLFLYNQDYKTRLISEDAKTGEQYLTFVDDTGRNIGSYYPGYVCQLLGIPSSFNDRLLCAAACKTDSIDSDKFCSAIGSLGEKIGWWDINEYFPVSFSQLADLLDQYLILKNDSHSNDSGDLCDKSPLGEECP